jgi:lipopolysaccharide exporter
VTAEFASGTDRHLNQRIARGAAWMVGLRFADRTIGLLSTIVLARLLVPADFGLVVLAMAMVAAVGSFGEFGFEMGLIQNQKADRSHYDTAWTLGLLRGMVAAVVVALAAEPLGEFFDNPRLGDVLLALALAPFLAGFNNIGTVAFRKDLALNKEFIFRIVPRIAGVLTTIAFAFAWRNYWALVCGTLAGTGLRLLMSYWMHGYRPRISVAAWREIMGFSTWMLVTSIATLASRKGGTLIIAKFLDAASLGIFSIAGQIANMASAELIAPVKQALFPGYAKLAHDTALLRKAFLDVYGILVLLALPAAIGIGLTAEFFVPLLLGPKWVDAVPLIEILVISGGLRSLSGHVRPVYLALNRPDLGAYGSIGRAVVYLPALVFALLYYGIEGAAVAHAAGHVAVLLSSLYLMHRLLAVTLGDVSTACWRPLVGCTLMIVALCVIKWFAPIGGSGNWDYLALLALSVAAGVITYGGSVLLLWRLSGRPTACAEAYLLSYLSYRFVKKSRLS